uniref:CCHC-type domain-containing protein n=1 Tax=Tanacetum cinerariifolium TaxID=118510 RepID=A0A6L2M7Y6_TANCI|nr:hypothetical protein [Tanacetum cinerariifolium]
MLEMIIKSKDQELEMKRAKVFRLELHDENIMASAAQLKETRKLQKSHKNEHDVSSEIEENQNSLDGNKLPAEIEEDLVSGLRGALKSTRANFFDYRKRYHVQEKPLYQDAGPGGLVLSTREYKARKQKQEEDMMNILMMGNSLEQENEFEKLKVMAAQLKETRKLQKWHKNEHDVSSEIEKNQKSLDGNELPAEIEEGQKHEAKFIQMIVEEVSLELHFISLDVDGKLIGTKTQIHDVVSRLETSADDVLMIGIKGMGSVGKTTLARAVLVVLDDIDHIDQLEALVGYSNWYKPGSRIIITTRDEQVLVAHKVNLIHAVDLLSDKEAICLFSRYAFGKKIHIQGYKELSKQVACYAGGLPLTIKVLGSFLCDVACVLKRWNKDEAIIAHECCGFHARNGLRVLEQKSLITISDYEELGMHDHIEETGKNIVRRLHPTKPNKHSRLWIDEEIKYILANDLGTDDTTCISVYTDGFKSFEVQMKGLANMKELRLLDLYTAEVSLDRIWDFDKVNLYLPNSLWFLKWTGYPFAFLHSTFQNLVGLDMYHSFIDQLWDDGEQKVLSKLKFLSIHLSLLGTLDFRLALNVETEEIKRIINRSETAKKNMEGLMASKPTEMLKRKIEEIELYNSTINQPKSHHTFRRHKCFKCKQRGHIMKTCPMIKQKEEIKRIINMSETAKKNMEGLMASKPTDDVIEIKGTLYSTKVTTFNKYVAFLNLVKQDEIISKNRTHSEEGEILGLTKQDGEKIKRCYINYWDIFISYYKTARVPNQDQRSNLDIPAKSLEVGKGYTCPITHQWDFGKCSATNLEVASKKGKEKLEHFRVKLEEEKEYHDRKLFHPMQQNKRSIQYNDIKIKEEATSSTSSKDLVIV